MAMCPHCKHKQPEWITMVNDCLVCSECAKDKFTPAEIEKIVLSTEKRFNEIEKIFAKPSNRLLQRSAKKSLPVDSKQFERIENLLESIDRRLASIDRKTHW